MRFEQALASMREGKRVKRDSWVNDGVRFWPFWYIPDGLCEIHYHEPIHNMDGVIEDHVRLDNIFAEDWSIYEEAKP